MIILYVPAYVPSSNGIRIWYTLAKICHDENIPVKVVCFEKRRTDHIVPDRIIRSLEIQYLEEGSITVGDDDVVFYPETVKGNPLNARCCVRYLLNNPIVLTGHGVCYGKRDYIVTYSSLIAPWFSMYECFILNDDISEISKIRESAKRDILTFYFGKIRVGGSNNRFNKVLEIINHNMDIEVITRSIPMSRETALKSIAQSRLLISFDPLSNINYEATLLGTPVILMDDSYEAKNFNMGDYGLYLIDEIDKVIASGDDRAWVDYCTKIDNQGKNVRDLIEVIELHFIKLDNSWRYRAFIRLNNLLRRIYDRIIATARHGLSKYININSYEDLPPYIYGCLRDMKVNKSDWSVTKQKGAYFKKRAYRIFKDMKFIYRLAYPVRKAYKYFRTRDERQ